MRFSTSSPNSHRIETREGVEVLFSYAVAVAAFLPGVGYVRTSTRHSNTTQRHINDYLRTAGRVALEVPQAVLDALEVCPPAAMGGDGNDWAEFLQKEAGRG